MKYPGSKKSQLIIWLMIFSLAMTATPIVILANKIRPFVMGMSFFAFWNIFWPIALFILSLGYSRVKDQEDQKLKHKM